MNREIKRFLSRTFVFTWLDRFYATRHIGYIRSRIFIWFHPTSLDPLLRYFRRRIEQIAG